MSSCDTGIAMKPMGGYIGLNRSALNEAAHKLVSKGSLPTYSLATNFEVKSTISVVVCKCSESILLESYTISANSVDLRSEEAIQNISAVVNKDAVKNFTNLIFSPNIMFDA
jgi:hypothetical protein